MPEGLRLGVPRAGQRIFFGDAMAAAIYDAALARLAKLGAKIVEIDIEPFYETARLLYDGPWVAERYIVARALIASSPESMHPVTREIILDGARPSAVDAFAAFYKLEELRRVRDHVFRGIDALVLPTMPTVYTVEQVLADPIQLNSRLGTYTNFVNLLELCGLAVPAAMRDDGAPPASRCWRRADATPGWPPSDAHFMPTPTCRSARPARRRRALAACCRGADEIAIAVVGAHLSGMPLNGELRGYGARFLRGDHDRAGLSPLALAGTRPPSPDCCGWRAARARRSRSRSGRCRRGFGRFVAAVPPPMSIGTLVLADGGTVKGFLVEAEAVPARATFRASAAGAPSWRKPKAIA